MKLNGWKKRREDVGPKTIDEIHKEIKKEQLQQKLADLTPVATRPSKPDQSRIGKQVKYDHGRKIQKVTAGWKCLFWFNSKLIF